MSIEHRALQQLQISQEIVEVYRDHLTSESLIGVISGCSDIYVYLSLYSDAGTANGIAIIYRADVTRIRWAGNERRSMAELVAATGATPTRPAVSLQSLQTILEDVSKAFGYVNVLAERMDSGITFMGEIVALDEQSLLLETYGTFSSRDRSKLLLRCEEITRVDADATYERSVSFLARKAG